MVDFLFIESCLFETNEVLLIERNADETGRIC